MAKDWYILCTPKDENGNSKILNAIYCDVAIGIKKRRAFLKKEARQSGETELRLAHWQRFFRTKAEMKLYFSGAKDQYGEYIIN